MGEKAVLLRQVGELVLMFLGGGNKAFEKHYGVDKLVTTLAPFGMPFAQGLRRRPVFASANTTKVIAKIAWAWTTAAEEKPILSHLLLYIGFLRGDHKDSSALNKLDHKAAELSGLHSSSTSSS